MHLQGSSLSTISKRITFYLISIYRPRTKAMDQLVLKFFSCNAIENVILLCSNIDGDSYDLHAIQEHITRNGESTYDSKRDLGVAIVFVAYN